ncbi:MAG: hypothetical protein SFV52_13025 [Saprospiraceae bacterium]|nr:hypothetical protein [Saprospiraceae bacterium]
MRRIVLHRQVAGRTILLIAFSLLALYPLSAQNDSLPEEPRRFFFKGYLKDLQTATFTPEEGSLLTGNFLHNRLNFRGQPTSALTFRLEVRTRLFWGEDVKVTPGFAEQVDYENGWMDLSWIVVDDSAVVLHTIADRLLLNWRRGPWDVTVGRQRINWGMSTAWNPNDLFNAYNFFDFDYEERPGSDAIRLRYRLKNGMSGLEAAFSRQQADSTAIAALLYRFNHRGYDVQALAGLYRQDVALGLGWAGSIGDAGFRGEATYFQPTASFWDTVGVLSFTVGADYSFAGGWYAGASFLYGSAGVDDALPPNRFYNQELSAKLLMPYRYNFLTQTSRQWTPLFYTQLNLVYSPGADAFLVFPVLTYSVANNWDADLVVQSFFAPLDGHFKNRGNALIFRLRWGF